jgi:uncharacterized protein YccT (UPF0319 family)
VDEMGKNLSGGLLRKQHCDMMNEGDHEVVLKWWKSTTMISPIHKDVKRRHISAKVFEKHLTHCL